MTGPLDLLAMPVVAADAALGHLLPPLGRLVAWAALAAAASMALYWRLSRQDRLAALAAEIDSVRRRAAAESEDPSRQRDLLRRWIGLSLRRLRLALIPSLAAGLPILALIVPLGDVYALQHALDLPGPAWLGRWETVFLGALVLFSLAIKAGFRIR